MMKFRYIRIFLLLLFFPCQCAMSYNKIVISKKNLMLYVINDVNDTIFSAPVGLGLNKGHKVRRGDKKTPEGSFTIIKIQDAKHWTHDFGDGAGQRKGAYGPWFFRLKVPCFSGIGIHGTCFPETIGTRSSEGCIRLKNDDVLVLKQYVYIGMTCVIEKDSI